jgi:hypothetical protein
MRFVRQRIRETRPRFVARSGMPDVPEYQAAQETVDFFRAFENGVWRRVEFRGTGDAAGRLFDLRQSRRARLLSVLTGNRHRHTAMPMASVV